jgi:hypothetical protein
VMFVIRYHSGIKTIFGSSLPPVLCYLHYLCLFARSGGQHISCCVFALFVFFLCTICCQFHWILHFLLPVPYSLTFISINAVFILVFLYGETPYIQPYVNIYVFDILH